MIENRNRGLRFERLEGRQMMTGNVTANLSGGTLFLHGDNSDNVVSVHEAPSGVFTVAGDASTSINGLALGNVAVFNSVKGIWADMKGGNDVLSLGSSPSVAAGGLNLKYSVFVDMGSGNNQLSMVGNIGGSVTALGGSGVDAIALYDSTVGGVVVINAGGGNNRETTAGVSLDGGVLVQNDNIGLSLIVDTGSGSDEVGVVDTSVRYATVIDTGSGNDSVSLTSAGTALALNQSGNRAAPAVAFGLVSDSAVIITAGGNDVVDMDSSTINYITVDTGPGNDTVNLAAASPGVGNNTFKSGIFIDFVGNDTFNKGGQVLPKHLLVLGYDTVNA